jgi:hypothetical protein
MANFDLESVLTELQRNPTIYNINATLKEETVDVLPGADRSGALTPTAEVELSQTSQIAAHAEALVNEVVDKALSGVVTDAAMDLVMHTNADEQKDLELADDGVSKKARLDL